MFHHIRKFSSTAKAGRRAIDHQQPGRGGRVFQQGISKVNKGEKFPADQIGVVGGGGGEVGLDRGSLKSFFLDRFPADQISIRPFKVTDEISLRSFQVTDVDDMMAWGTDEKLSRYCNWEVPQLTGEGGQSRYYCHWRVHKPLTTKICPGMITSPGAFCYHGWELRIYKSKEDALDDIKNNIIPHPWFRAICLNNRPIGKIFVDPCLPKDPYMAELGFVVASEHWGKGIATTSVNMVLDTIFKEWPHLQRLQAHVNVENLGAQRVLEKAGFRDSIEGGLRTMHYPDKQGREINMMLFKFIKGDKRGEKK